MSRLLRVLCGITVAVCFLAQAKQYEQCKDPLFETHWAGKIDIPTFTAIPTVNTNLLKCRAYNERASCCSQGVETEQSKYFGFWRDRFLAIFWRVFAHRNSVLAYGLFAVQNQTASDADVDQFNIVKRRYETVLSPLSQSACLTGLLTYVAGMMCFACKPDWFQYSVVLSNSVAKDQLVRVRMPAQVCNQLWASCAAFSSSVVDLRNALRDSKLARAASGAEESLDFFLGKGRLCDWAHDQIALHPFKQPSREDQDIPVQMPAPVQRRLQVIRELDVLAEGRKTGFDVAWQGVRMISRSSQKLAVLAWIIALAWASALCSL